MLPIVPVGRTIGIQGDGNAVERRDYLGSNDTAIDGVPPACQSTCSPSIPLIQACHQLPLTSIGTPNPADLELDKNNTATCLRLCEQANYNVLIDCQNCAIGIAGGRIKTQSDAWPFVEAKQGLEMNCMFDGYTIETKEL